MSPVLKNYKDFLNESSSQDWTQEELDSFKKYNLFISLATKNSDNSINYNSDIDLSYHGLNYIPFNFREIKGSFNCSGNKLVSLEGGPEVVGGDFDCSYNELVSLERGPKTVKHNFNCSMNKLVSLEGAPEVVGGGFRCYSNKLISLEGAPREVHSDFQCSTNNLVSLVGAPKVVRGDFYCYDNKLLSLKNNFKIRGKYIFENSKYPYSFEDNVDYLKSQSLERQKEIIKEIRLFDPVSYRKLLKYCLKNKIEIPLSKEELDMHDKVKDLDVYGLDWL